MLFAELLGNGEAFGLRGTIVIDRHREHKRTRWFKRLVFYALQIGRCAYLLDSGR
jgi:hypothetical protein